MPGIDVDTLILELREHLGLSDQASELDDSDALLILNRSWWEFQNKTALREKEKTVEFDISEASDFYEVPQPIEAIKTLTIVDPDTLEQTQLDRMSQAFYSDNANDSVDLREKPRKYLREKDGFKLFPHPDKVYRLKMFRYITLDDLVSGGDIEVPQFWHDVILYGGVYRGFMRLNDLNRAEFFRNQQADIMNTSVPTEAEEEADSKLAGLQVVGYDKNNL